MAHPLPPAPSPWHLSHQSRFHLGSLVPIRQKAVPDSRDAIQCDLAIERRRLLVLQHRQQQPCCKQAQIRELPREQSFAQAPSFPMSQTLFLPLRPRYRTPNLPVQCWTLLARCSLFYSLLRGFALLARPLSPQRSLALCSRPRRAAPQLQEEDWKETEAGAATSEGSGDAVKGRGIPSATMALRHAPYLLTRAAQGITYVECVQNDV